jgi:hypothetical protein
MIKIQIYKIINPYLLKILNTNYIDKYITLDIIDFFYYFYNKNYNSINNDIIKNIQNQFKQNNSYLECTTIDINDLFKDISKELSVIENFKIINDDIYIKHLDLITNINIINNTDTNINNNGYIKIFKIPNNRINIYFE